MSAGPSGAPPQDGAARAFAKKLLWPAMRFFDPRFIGVHEAVQDLKSLVVADTNAANETAAITGRALADLRANAEEQRQTLEEQSEKLAAMQAQLDDVTRWISFDPEEEPSIGEIDEQVAKVLNYGASHKGFAAQANLWLNPPILLGYEPGRVALRWVNERLAEQPYTFRALSSVEPGGRVLDVGAAESPVCLSLATIGYRVTAVDPRPIPFSHERLQVVQERIEEWEPDGEFDAVVCLSTIEHLGTEAYEQTADQDRVDLEAMKRMRELTRLGGVLVLTTAAGSASLGKHGRVYDRDGLDELLEGWDVEDLSLVQRRDATTWVLVEEPIEELEPELETVAMITAKRAD